MNCDEKILHLKVLDLKIADYVLVFVCPWVDIFVRPMHICAIDHTAHALHFHIFQWTLAVPPFREGEGYIHSINRYIELRVVPIILRNSSWLVLVRLTLCCCRRGSFERRSLADLGFLLSWSAGDEDVAEGDDSISPFWYDGIFKDDLDARGLGEIVSNPSGERFYYRSAQPSSVWASLNVPWAAIVLIA